MTTLTKIEAEVPSAVNDTGPFVAMRGIYEAAKNNPFFHWVSPMRQEEPTPNTVRWYWNCRHWPFVLADIEANRRFAVGPFVMFRNALRRGAGIDEQRALAYTNYAAIFHHSKWYMNWGRQVYAQQVGHWALEETPVLPQILAFPWKQKIIYDALIYLKYNRGTAIDVAAALEKKFASPITIRCNHYVKHDLMFAASRARVCIFVTQHDNNPSSAKEILAMGCPIISHDRACPMIIDGLNGVSVSIRDEGDPSKPWSLLPEAPEMLFAAAQSLQNVDRGAIRETLLRQTNPASLIERIILACQPRSSVASV